MGFSFLSGSSFTIFIGVFVTLAVMGTATLYDRYKSTGKTPFNEKQLKFLSELNQKLKELSSKGKNSLAEFNKKLFDLISKTIGENKLESIKVKLSNLKDKIQKTFDTVQSKITSSPTFLSIKDKLHNNKLIQRSNKKDEIPKITGTEEISSVNVDKIVESKKDEFDFDDKLLTEMSTSGSIKDKDNNGNINAASLNSDLTIDENEFNIGFEDTNEEASPEGSLSFNANSKEIDLADEHDSLLDSLKKDIVTSHEKKVNFMANMQGENLDVKLIKSDLEDVLKNLRKYKQQANNN